MGVAEMALIDADLHQSLNWMACVPLPTPTSPGHEAHHAHVCSENDITDAGLENDFIDEYDNFGVMETVELKPGGASIQVTEENKMEYIHLLCKHRLEGRVEEQVRAFRQGLHEVVPAEALAIFDERELEVSAIRGLKWRYVDDCVAQLLIGGLSDVDVDDWKKVRFDSRPEKALADGGLPSTPTTEGTRRPTRSSSGSGRCAAQRLVSGRPSLILQPLSDHPVLADGEAVAPAPVHDRHVAHARQRLPGPSGLGRSAQVHHREGRCCRGAAEDPYCQSLPSRLTSPRAYDRSFLVLQPARPPALRDSGKVASLSV